MSLADELRWAYSYDAYDLIASDTEGLARVLKAPRDEYETTRRVPDWVGTHVLRAWLFLLQRIDHWNDGGTAGDEEWQAVMTALAQRGQTVSADQGVPDVGSQNQPGALSSGEGVLADAVATLANFLADTPLTTRINELEHQLDGRSWTELNRGVEIPHLGRDILNAALTVRRELGRHDDIIHAAVILAMLEHVMVEGERITVRPSLGAGNDPKVQHYDLETSHRIAEFKVSFWKGADTGRKRGVFADLAKLAMAEDGRKKQLFVVGEAPRRFLTTTTSVTGWGLARAAAGLRKAFEAKYRMDMPIHEFTTTHAADVEIIDVSDHLPQLRAYATGT